MPPRPIRKVLVANRGEIALRVIRTCREMGIRTVSVYSTADRSAPHVRAADEAFAIGPPPSRESYLLIDAILGAASASGADAIHPGYGFLSENPEFARRVRQSGLVFIGPSAEAIASMGDKTAARSLASAAGVPMVPGTAGPVSPGPEAAGFCARHGYPVLVKAAAGGGGKGMRIVREERELASSLRAAASEARSAFGDERVYIEKYFEDPRHIEIQVMADSHGNVVHLGERECSIQRRHQKVVEESPSVIVDEVMRSRMGETAVMVARACRYENAGTVEFLVDREKNFYFLEMNTRIQVEHPVTELRTGLDLVSLQIRIAAGGFLPFAQDEVTFRGHAIECRICAEDTENNFLPSTGRISHLKGGSGPGIREDRGVEEGEEIGVHYDPLMSKLIAWGGTRHEAIARLVRALREYEILGVRTNIPLCVFVLTHPAFAAGDISTHFIHTYFPLRRRLPDDLPEEGAVAAVCAHIAGGTNVRESTPREGPAGNWRLGRRDYLRGR